MRWTCWLSRADDPPTAWLERAWSHDAASIVLRSRYSVAGPRRTAAACVHYQNVLPISLVLRTYPVASCTGLRLKRDPAQAARNGKRYGYRSYTKATTTRRTAAVVLCTPAQPHKGSTGAVPQRDRRAVRRRRSEPTEGGRVNAQLNSLQPAGTWVTPGYRTPAHTAHRVRDHIGPHTCVTRAPRPAAAAAGVGRPRTTRASAPGRIRRARRPFAEGCTGCDMCPRCQLCSDVRARAHFNTHFCRDCGLV